jgi:acetylornithine deacetylase
LDGAIDRPEVGEHRVTEYLDAQFQRLGLPYVRQQVHPFRDNIIARLDGDAPAESGGELLMYAVHQDTVPVEGMSVAPFTPEIRDGRLYGRGACDVKGGMAAMLTAVARLAEERPAGRPTLLLACTVNEECGFSGARALAETLRNRCGGIAPRLPDAAVVAEPTGLDVVVAHKGTIRWRCHTTGRAAHSSRPQEGVNAIFKMAQVLRVLERYQSDVVGTLHAHLLCGPATMSVGMIHGGISANVVPDRCTIEIDRRLPPGEDAATAYRHVIDHLANHPDLGFEILHDPPYMQGLAMSDAGSAAVAARLASITRDVTGQSRPVGVPYATDAAFFAAAGIPSVVYGPGSIAQAHTKDEWIALDQLEQAVEVLYRLGRRGLRGEAA